MFYVHTAVSGDAPREGYMMRGTTDGDLANDIDTTNSTLGQYVVADLGFIIEQWAPF